jgi:hypothetical protein
MKLYLIAYDLRQPGCNYSGLYDEIKSLSGENGWQHPLESCWIVKVGDASTVDSVTGRIRSAMDEKDCLFVVDITGCDYQGWLPRSFWEWIKE